MSSQSISKAGMHVKTKPSGRLRASFLAAPVLAAAAAALLSGCANRDSVTVGAIPDDYRTNHPIVISEKNEKIDLPVGMSERGMTQTQRTALLGFLDNYDRSAAPTLTILSPSGSANERAAAAAARDFARLATRNGVHSSRIVMASYQADASETSSPIRVSYARLKAHTNKCGRWPDDLLETTENKHYANFGCSYQNNLAAQMANPADLLGPRKQTPIDAERRSKVIDGYRNVELAVPPVNQEVDY